MEKQKRILLISHNDKFGGAARAVLRLFKCLNSENIKTTMIVMHKHDPQNEIMELSIIKKSLGYIFSIIDINLSNFLIPQSTQWKTSAFFGVLSARHINKSQADVINLHWLGHGLISLRQLRKIKKPIIWTLQDEWAMHPISHFPVDIVTNKSFNHVRKYITRRMIQNRANLKRKFILKDNVNLIALNGQMKSKLLLKYPEKRNKIFTIANPVDLSSFNPDNRNFYADSLALSVNKPTIVFLGGTKDMRKGWDLLEQAIKFTKMSFDLIVVGGSTRKIVSGHQEINIIGIEKILDLNNLIDLYISCTAVIVPSRHEGLPQTATESLSCGTPVIGFKIDGLLDIVFDDYNGYLVEPFDVQKLGLAIDQTIHLGKNYFKNNCRLIAEEKFACRVVKSKYDSIFR